MMTHTPLLERAHLAIEDSRELQRQSQIIRRQVDRERQKLRLAVFEAAMARSESKAFRDNKL